MKWIKTSTGTLINSHLIQAIYIRVMVEDQIVVGYVINAQVGAATYEFGEANIWTIKTFETYEEAEKSLEKLYLRLQEDN